MLSALVFESSCSRRRWLISDIDRALMRQSRSICGEKENMLGSWKTSKFTAQASSDSLILRTMQCNACPTVKAGIWRASVLLTPQSKANERLKETPRNRQQTRLDSVSKDPIFALIHERGCQLPILTGRCPPHRWYSIRESATEPHGLCQNQQVRFQVELESRPAWHAAPMKMDNSKDEERRFCPS